MQPFAVNFLPYNWKKERILLVSQSIKSSYCNDEKN